MDAVVGVALGVVALLLRWHFPHDGYFYDDAWVAVGASKASLTNAVTVGQSQFGFTMIVAAWSRLFGQHGELAFVGPTLVFGAVGPVLVFVALRHFGFARSIATLIGAMLAVASTDVAYSSRVKAYTGALLIVLFFATVVPVLARRQWGPRVAILWVVLSVVVGCYSTFGLIAAAVGSLVLVLHPARDIRWRLGAVAAEGLMLVTLIAFTSRTYKGNLIVAFFRPYNAYIAFTWNPISLASRIVDHSTRVASVFPGVHGLAASACIVATAIALALIARRGSRAILARYLLLLIAAAIVGAIAGIVPFGPETGAERVVLWLIPAIAVGLAVLLEYARRATARTKVARLLFDALAFGAAAGLLVGATGTPPDFAAGSRAASQLVANDLGPHDAVLVTQYGQYSFALYSRFRYHLVQTPNLAIGFEPKFDDPRIAVVGFKVVRHDVAASTRTADRVIVVHAEVAGSWYDAILSQISGVLVPEGFRLTSQQLVDGTRVQTYIRGATKPHS